jgi:hypothetical protein
LASGLHRCRSVHPAEVVACRHLRIHFARPPSVDDVAGVAVSRLPELVEEPFFNWRASRLGGALRRSTCVHRGFGPLHAPIASRVSLLADVGRRALGRLLDEHLRLSVQVPRLGRRGGGHGPQQHRGGNELLAHSRRRVWVVDVEIGVDAAAGLYAQLPHALATRRGFPRHRGPEQPHRPILLRQLGFELTGLG